MPDKTIRGTKAASEYLREITGQPRIAHQQTIREAIIHGELPCSTYVPGRGRIKSTYVLTQRELRTWSKERFGV